MQSVGMNADDHGGHEEKKSHLHFVQRSRLESRFRVLMLEYTQISMDDV